MRVTIDKAGRMVIPRSVRIQLGLAAGGEVEVAVEGAAIRLEPVAGAGLDREGRFLVIPAEGTPLDDAAVRELRHADQR